VVLNLWATWCPPCIDEFPELVKLHNNYRSKGLVVMSVSMDHPRDGDKMVEFVEQQKAGFPIYIRSSGSVDDFFLPVDKSWTGAMPSTYFFKRDGKPAGKPVMSRVTYEELVKLVEPLLK
jgi:thiol-disulfide isomerase/thioredoxin